MLPTILIILFILSCALLVYAWKSNVVSSKEQTIESGSQVNFYNNENYVKGTPKFSSNFGCLDGNVSGAVRYNRSMYYNEEEYIKYKEKVLSENLPI